MNDNEYRTRHALDCLYWASQCAELAFTPELVLNWRASAARFVKLACDWVDTPATVELHEDILKKECDE